MSRNKISQVRSTLYKYASILGDIQAVLGGPKAVIKRAARKKIYKKTSRIIKKVGL